MTTTVFTPHESYAMVTYEDNEVTADVNEVTEMFKLLADTGLEDSDPNKHSLGKIGKSHDIVDQEIPSSNLTLPDITDIPDGITVNTTDESDTTEDNRITPDGGESAQGGRGNVSFSIIIDILS